MIKLTLIFLTFLIDKFSLGARNNFFLQKIKKNEENILIKMNMG